MEILSLDQAKQHLKLSPDIDTFDEDVQSKLDQAHAIIADYIASGRVDPDWAAEVEAWDDETAPGYVKAAVLKQLGELWRWRGDQGDGEMPERAHGFLAPDIVALLHRARDPVIA